MLGHFAVKTHNFLSYRYPLPDPLPDLLPDQLLEPVTSSLPDPLPDLLPYLLPDLLSDPLSYLLTDQLPEPLPELLPDSLLGPSAASAHYQTRYRSRYDCIIPFLNLILRGLLQSKKIMKGLEKFNELSSYLLISHLLTLIPYRSI